MSKSILEPAKGKTIWTAKEGTTMTTAAIYCRVSTDNQEREGTSLQTQLENCLTYCKGKGYDAPYRFSESYSGLSLERPELDKLREIVRTEAIDVVVCYSLDRLTRDPGHGVIITQELEKHRVALESVTEDIDNTELGKLISYIRGFAAKLEADKIRERTLRGKRAAKEAGRIFTGSGLGVYGYDYLKRIKGERQASRVTNETEAIWVRRIFSWLVNDSLSSSAIVYRLRSLGAPTKSGKVWGKSSVQRILKNPAYAGRGNATPAIIEGQLFDDAQKQLMVNFAKSPRNIKHEYLLRGHMRCRQCGRAYTGEPHRGKTYYRCSGRRRINITEQCRNRMWQASELEAIVWKELSVYLGKRDLIETELEKQRQDAGQLKVFEDELQRVERQLQAADREQHQLLQWALKGFPESQVEAENRRLNKAKETLKAQKTELETQLKASQDAVINIPKLEGFIRDIQDKLPTLDFEGKRLALDMLGITVWLDGENVEVTGIIEAEKDVRCTTTTLSDCSRNTALYFSFGIAANGVSNAA